ncbi:MAG: transglycosylase SLT domain-containing protein [Bacteroidales bacterium]|nr:transglycosylase SLT domain-containing protein [Bacteroidales bacterium]
MALLFENKITENKTKFIGTVIDIAKRLDIDPNWLMALMYHESGLNHKAQNSMGCVGLIQFCPVVYRDTWGISKDYLLNISNVHQLNFVLKYLTPYAGLMKKPIDVFLAAFYPYALKNKKLNDKKWAFGSEKSLDYAKIVKNWNPGFDVNNDGVITSNDYIKYHNSFFQKYGIKQKKCPCGIVIPILILIALLIFIQIKFKIV